MGAKAIRLVTNGKVSEQPYARVFEVEASSGGVHVAEPTVTCERPGTVVAHSERSPREEAA